MTLCQVVPLEDSCEELTANAGQLVMTPIYSSWVRGHENRYKIALIAVVMTCCQVVPLEASGHAVDHL